MRIKRSNRKIITIALIGVAVVGIASALIFTRAQQPGPPEGTLDWYEDQAYLGGYDTWELGSGKFEYIEPDTWDEILATQSLVVVEPLGAKSYPNFDSTGIWSWWRFRVLEVLSQKDVSLCYSCSVTRALPADFPAPQSDQIVLQKYSGALSHNGIWLESVEPSFPEYVTGQKYLLVLDLDPRNRMGEVRMGPLGVYRIDASGNLTCVCEFVGRENPYKEELTARYGNSLASLRAALTGVPGPTPTLTPTPTRPVRVIHHRHSFRNARTTVGCGILKVAAVTELSHEKLKTLPPILFRADGFMPRSKFSLCRVSRLLPDHKAMKSHGTSANGRPIVKVKLT